MIKTTLLIICLIVGVFSALFPNKPLILDEEDIEPENPFECDCDCGFDI